MPGPRGQEVVGEVRRQPEEGRHGFHQPSVRVRVRLPHTPPQPGDIVSQTRRRHTLKDHSGNVGASGQGLEHQVYN